MIHIGFTGTRHGMTDAQQQALYEALWPYTQEEGWGGWAFHHGDCQGADAQAHRIAWLTLGAIVHVHPPDKGALRAYCVGPSRVIRYPQLPYLLRNWAIVEACTLLIAAPQEAQETQRSGTWTTVRYAQKVGIPVMILLPTAVTAEPLRSL
jgi:hypothetical protein